MPRCGEAIRFGFFCYQPYAAIRERRSYSAEALRRSILLFLDLSAKNLMPRSASAEATQRRRCGEAFHFMDFSATNLMPRSASAEATQRRRCGEAFCFSTFSATNLMPRCCEAFRFWLFLLRTLCRAAAKHFILWIFLLPTLCRAAAKHFILWILLLPTLCRDAAKHFAFGFFCYQPYAAIRERRSYLVEALRRSISFLHFSAKNLMPRCCEAFRFWLFLLRTLCRAAAKHPTFFGFIC
jgi:hypothetical protein